MSVPAWLPPLVRFEDYYGDWPSYLDSVYAVFRQDFLGRRPTFFGKRMGLKRMPLTDGKEATFWHFIQEGESEEERIPDLRRCERIRWIRPVIEHADCDCVKVWAKPHKGTTRVMLWLEEQEYLVVLDDRDEYVLPWTAYTVTEDYRKRKLQKEYETFRKS